MDRQRDSWMHGIFTFTMSFIKLKQTALKIWFYQNQQIYLMTITSLIIITVYMKKFLHSDWLRAVQLIPNSAKT